MSRRILLVDDDPAFRALVRPALVARGYELDEAAGTDEAETLARLRTPDLLVVDGLLPGLDGASWLSRLPDALRPVPKIFVSSFWRSARDQQRLVEKLGVRKVIHKPLAPAELAEQVDALLGAATPPLPHLPPDALATLEALREEYARALPERLREAEAAVLAAAKRPQEPEVRAHARMLAHRIAGTAGSYGFEPVGAAAATLEEALLAIPEDADEGAFASARAAAQRLSAQSPRPQRDPTPTPAPRSAQPRILVVDDDPVVLELLRSALAQQAVHCVGVLTGEEALEEARTLRPDGAILDVRLAEGRSYGLAQSLRAMPGLESLPLAFMSGDGSNESRVAAAHAGASIFLRKPLDVAGLPAVVRQMLAQRDAARPRALVLDDDPVFLAQVSAMLRSDGLLVARISEGAKLLDALQEHRPDLLLLDVMMPGLDGFDLCRMVRTAAEWQDLPVICVTASASVEARIAAFRAGADDLLQKPLVREELLARVRARLERARLVRERSWRDSLTGTLLRRAFVETLEARLADARRRNEPFHVAMLDLDDFKLINDRHGHLAGDRVLARMGALLNGRFRAEDVRGRWGGEEFVLGVNATTPELATMLVERLLRELRTLEFASDDGTPFRVSFTAGVAGFPADGSSSEDLLRRADGRLLAAKRLGKGRVLSTDP